MHRKSKKVLAALCASAFTVAICLPTVLAGFTYGWIVTGTGTGQAYSRNTNDNRVYRLEVAVEDKSSGETRGYAYKDFHGTNGEVRTANKYYSMTLYKPWGNIIV